MLSLVIFALFCGSIASVKALHTDCETIGNLPWIEFAEHPAEEGLWYLASSHKNLNDPDDITCPKMSYFRSANVYIYTFSFDLNGQIVTNIGNITLSSNLNGLIGELEFLGDLYHIQVAGLDYVNWAILYLCGDKGGTPFEMYWILSRTRSMDSGLLTECKARVDAFGGDSAAMKDFVQTDCDIHN